MSKKILLVEDNVDERNFMKLLLELLDYEVIEADNGQQAIKLVKELHPDLVIMDIAMPVLNGLSAARNIRAEAECSQVPIIAVTGFRNYYDTKAIDAGCTYMIDKPIDFHKLESAINQCLA